MHSTSPQLALNVRRVRVIASGGETAAGPELCRQLCGKQGDRLTVRISYMPLSSNADHSQTEPFCLTRHPRTPSEPPTSHGEVQVKGVALG